METGSTPIAENPNSKLRWFQFSLRTLLIFVTLFAIVCSWFAVKMQQARKQRKAVDAIEKMGVLVRYDTHFGTIDPYHPFSPSFGLPSKPKWLRNLFGDDFLARVTDVEFDGENTSDADVQAIMEELKQLGHLQTLRMGYNTRITDVGLESIEELSQLKELNLSMTLITDSGLVHLKGLARLQRLYLDYTPNVTDAGLQHLEGLSLQSLVLSYNKITDIGLQYLNGMPLRELDLRECPNITDSGLRHLKRCTQLQLLLLNGTHITDDGLIYIKGLTQLQHLDLTGNLITDSGLKHIEGLKELKVLGLGGTSITDSALKHIERLSQLRKLILSFTRVSDSGLNHLNGLCNLETLELWNTGITDAGVQNLQKALPKVKIDYQRSE